VDGDRRGVEPPTVVTDLEQPGVVVEPGRDPGAGRGRVLAHILQRFLHHPQDHRLRGLVEAICGRLELDLDRQPGEGRHVVHAVADRAVETEVLEERRPQLADEAAHVAELAAEQFAQEAELGAREPAVLVEHALDVLDLEDGVGQRLCRSVVHLLGEADPLGLLGLHDAHPQVGRELRVGGVGEQARIAALQEEPRALEVLLGQLELAQLLLVEAELAREPLDLGAAGAPQRILGAGLGGRGRVGRVGGAGRSTWVPAGSGRAPARFGRVPSRRSSRSCSSRRACQRPSSSRYASRYRSRTMRREFAA